MYSLIHNGTLIDGNGGEPIENAGVLIQKDKILDSGQEDSLKIPNGKIRRLDAHEGFIMPGFIDSHTHIMMDYFHINDAVNTPLSLYFYNAARSLWRTLQAGVTTVRDAGMADYGVKNATERGLIAGPRLQISVMPLSITGGHFDFWLKSGFDVKRSYPGLPQAVCDGEDEVRKRVREVLRAGADVLKVMVTGGVISANDHPEHPQFTPRELEIMVEEAGYRELDVMAHAHGAKGIKNALNAGIKSIEHGTYIDQEGINLILENKAWLVPTIFVHQHNREKALAGEIPAYIREAAIDVADTHLKNIKKAYKAGVQLVMGTDCGIAPHGQNLRELGYLCEIGLKPMEAIQAGTIRAAECLGWQNNIGTIEKGKIADVTISKTNPLAYIKSLGNSENITMVMKEGKIVKNLHKND